MPENAPDPATYTCIDLVEHEYWDLGHAADRMDFIASISLDASPPEAILAKGRGGSPGFSEIRNSTESIPGLVESEVPYGLPAGRGLCAGDSIGGPNRHTILRV